MVSRSNNPLALSVVTLTEPGDVRATFERITEFDDRDFGFNHNQTWNALPKALRGMLDPASVASSFRKAPKRVQNCIAALCALGKIEPLETRAFADYPQAKLRTVSSIDWDPEVVIRVKATCWYVKEGRARIPLLQPRKCPLEPDRLALYLMFAQLAYCKDDWADVEIELIDISGNGEAYARFVDVTQLPVMTDRDLRDFVQTYIEAKRLADVERAKRPKKPTLLPMDELLGLEP